MKVKELKEIIKEMPDSMDVHLMDLTSDHPEDSVYTLSKGNFSVEKAFDITNDELEWDVLFITFKNKLNPNPIE